MTYTHLLRGVRLKRSIIYRYRSTQLYTRSVVAENSAGSVAPRLSVLSQHLDQRQIRHATMTAEKRTAKVAIYDVPVDALDATEPSVVTVQVSVGAVGIQGFPVSASRSARMARGQFLQTVEM
jgi:hypothetical protein